MEYVFEDVNEAFVVMWHRLMQGDGVIERPSRNGPMRESTRPVVLNYTRPRQRLLLLPERDANPIFHLMEGLWMLAGMRRVDFLSKFNSRMLDYSDDGVTLVSAYGAEWAAGIREIVRALRLDGNSRRAYVPIFKDTHLDGINGGWKDIPCNVGISFYVRDGRLDMTVFNRSNDMIWGALGANYVTFSFLQEYVARLVGVDVGVYSQISSCFHLYPEFDVAKKLLGKVPAAPVDYYAVHGLSVSPYHVLPIRGDAKDLRPEVELMVEWILKDRWLQSAQEPWFNNAFLRHVAWPIYCGWAIWRDSKDPELAAEQFNKCVASDWRFACRQWLAHRVTARQGGNAG